MLWSAVSNAAVRSNSTRTETIPEPTVNKMKLRNLMRAVSVLWRGLKCYTGKCQGKCLLLSQSFCYWRADFKWACGSLVPIHSALLFFKNGLVTAVLRVLGEKPESSELLNMCSISVARQLKKLWGLLRCHSYFSFVFLLLTLPHNRLWSLTCGAFLHSAVLLSLN